MTAQISDIAFYNEKEFSIVGIMGEGLFNPYEHGLRPHGTCTACWRGFQVGYLVQDDQLFVDLLRINIENPQKWSLWKKKPPKLNGVRPGSSDEEDFALFDLNYNNVKLQLQFTGGLLLGNDFIHDLYVHMGFQDPWKYREVHEFIFNKGKLTEHRDVSEKMKQYREMVERGGGSPRGSGFESMDAWIRDCFSLDYRF